MCTSLSDPAMGWTVSPEFRPQNGAVSGDRAPEEVTKVTGGHTGAVQHDWCPQEEQIRTDPRTEEDTVRSSRRQTEQRGP